MRRAGGPQVPPGGWWWGAAPALDDGTFDRRADHWLDGVVEAVVEGRRGGRWRTLGAGRSPLAGLERGRARAATVAGEPAVEGSGA